MVLIRKPKPDNIRRFLKNQGKLDFTYEDVGATAGEPPAGYVVDHTRCRLGEGERIFAVAKSALEGWQQFRLGWLRAWPANTPIREGEVVAVVARRLGLWWLNACRVIYVVDQKVEKKKFGFAYGTLPGHAGTGEERFLIEMDDQGTVWYDILAFSRPHHPLAYVGYPYVRQVQRRFGKQSSAAMQKIAAAELELNATR